MPKPTSCCGLVPEPPRLREDWSLHIFADPKNHLLEVPGKESQSTPECTRLEVEWVDAVENPPKPGIITAKVDEIPYLQWGPSVCKIVPPAMESPQCQSRRVNTSMKYTSLPGPIAPVSATLDGEKKK